MRCPFCQKTENKVIDSRESQAALKTFLALKASAPKDVDVYGAAEVRDALQRGTAAQSIEVWPAWIPALDDPKQLLEAFARFMHEDRG